MPAVSNADVLLSPLTTREAVLSSKIEGTQTTMGEVLEYEAGAESFDADKVDDIHEVINYRTALRQAVTMMKKLSLCQRVIKQCHATLLSGVLGHDKAPGKYRTIQNFIGQSARIENSIQEL